MSQAQIDRSNQDPGDEDDGSRRRVPQRSTGQVAPCALYDARCTVDRATLAAEAAE